MGAEEKGREGMSVERQHRNIYISTNARVNSRAKLQKEGWVRGEPPAGFLKGALGFAGRELLEHPQTSSCSATLFFPSMRMYDVFW